MCGTKLDIKDCYSYIRYVPRCVALGDVWDGNRTKYLKDLPFKMCICHLKQSQHC